MQIFLLFEVSVVEVATEFNSDYFIDIKKWYTFKTTETFDLDYLIDN